MFNKKKPVYNKKSSRRRIIDPRRRMIFRQVIIGLGIFSVLTLILTGIWYGTRLSVLTLDVIEVEGGETISHELVEAKVRSELTGLYFGFIPKTFAWFYPEQKINQALMTVDRIKNPVLKRVSSDKLTVTFDEYIPSALWCQEDNQTCLLVDATGYAFARSPQLVGGALMRFYTLDRQPVIGDFVVNQSELNTMNTFIKLAFDQANLAISSVEIDAVKDVYYQLAQGGEIKVTLKMSATEAFSNLLAVLSAPEFKTLAPGNFQYIDLRFGSKVFVNDTEPNLATSPASTGGTTSTTSVDLQ